MPSTVKDALLYKSGPALFPFLFLSVLFPPPQRGEAALPASLLEWTLLPSSVEAFELIEGLG